MPCFILLTLAATLGWRGPADRAYVNRASIVTVRSALPPDAQRPAARAVVRLAGPSVVFVTEAPNEVVGAACAPLG